MNIKLHTPKSLKMGSGMGTLKQLLMSIVATSISIALTFGTAYVVDTNKKEQAKREMVMMLMYDMSQSLDAVQQTGVELSSFFDAQVKLLANPDLFEKENIELAVYIPQLDFTHTTENIFTSNIETINLLGNVLFVEKVSAFYALRENYQKAVVNEMQKNAAESYESYDALAQLNTPTYITLAVAIQSQMQTCYNECRKLMDVSDDDISVFRQKRQDLEESTKDPAWEKRQRERLNDMTNRKLRMSKAIEEGKKKLTGN